MEKYIFSQYNSSEYPIDPVFKTKDFTLFGNPDSFTDEPDLFEVYINHSRFCYCLVQPKELIKNEALLLKIKRYLLSHENKKNLNDSINAYFIGDMQKSIDVSNGFSNQNIILVTYEMIEQWYPKTPKEILKRVLESLLKKQKHLGQLHQISNLTDDELFVERDLSDNEKRDYRMYIQNSLKDEGFVSFVSGGFGAPFFVLTGKAIEFLDSNNEKNNVAFIAIKFDENEKRINAIQDAVSLAGYEPRIMNQVETNNWIMPEIFYQIKKAKFVVADFSLPCDGAYYEAGYAAALDKPVIHLFDRREETKTNKLHFDIAQKSTIFYDSYEDLKNRLINRIKATVK